MSSEDYKVALVSIPGNFATQGSEEHVTFDHIHNHFKGRGIQVETVWFQHDTIPLDTGHPYSCLPCRVVTEGATEERVANHMEEWVENQQLVKKKDEMAVETEETAKDFCATGKCSDLDQDHWYKTFFLHSTVCWQCCYITNIQKLLHTYPNIKLVAVDGGGKGCEWERGFLESDPRTRNKLHYVSEEAILKIYDTGGTITVEDLKDLPFRPAAGKEKPNDAAEKAYADGVNLREKEHWGNAIDKFKECVKHDSTNAKASVEIKHRDRPAHAISLDFFIC